MCQASLMDIEDQKQQLRALERRLGPNHPGLTETLDRLAAEYRRQGKEREAKRISRRVLKIWEESFVPEYGWRHLLSDLFGGGLTKVRPSLKFREESVLELSPEHLLGTGDNRSCYAYPGDPSRCIKVDKPWNEGFHNTRRKRVKKALMPWLADFSSNREEARFYRTKALELGEEFYRHAPRCYGIVLTNLGPGLVFERVRNSDGSYAMRLDQFVEICPGSIQILSWLVEDLFSFLIEKELYLFTANPDNFFVQLKDSIPARLVVIDWKTEGRTNSDLPIQKISKSIERKKFIRKFRELKSWISRIRDKNGKEVHGAAR